MMIKSIYPKTKNELIESLKKAKVTSLEIFDSADRKLTTALRKPQKANIRRTVIFIEEMIWAPQAIARGAARRWLRYIMLLLR